MAALANAVLALNATGLGRQEAEDGGLIETAARTSSVAF